MRLIFVHPIPVPHSFEHLAVFQSPEWTIEFDGEGGVRLIHESGHSFMHRGTGYSYGLEAPKAAPTPTAEEPKAQGKGKKR